VSSKAGEVQKGRPYPEQSDNQDVLVIAKTLLTEFDNLPDISINDLYVTIRDLSLQRLSGQGTDQTEKQVLLLH